MCPSDPGPSAEQLAAIVAAVEVAWPRPVVVAEAPTPPSPWRWSGRWWASAQPVAAERRRPTRP
ncbi:MAG TPA: hypothetical protein VGI06_10485 [Acidimicrobiales bacterium]|jgi:hypothetical protein